MSIGGIALHLRGEVRGMFMDWLRSYRPDLVERYEGLYARGAYAAPAERDGSPRWSGASAQAAGGAGNGPATARRAQIRLPSPFAPD